MEADWLVSNQTIDGTCAAGNQIFLIEGLFFALQGDGVATQLFFGLRRLKLLGSGLILEIWVSTLHRRGAVSVINSQFD